MANNAVNVALLGSTGLVGSHLLSSLLAHPSVARVDTISRRTPEVSGSFPNVKLTTFTEPDSSRWASQISQLAPPLSIFASSMGTSRARAGGLENQYKLDLDLNIECAKAAREAGAKVYVLVSSTGASSSSFVPYLKLKGKIEEEAQELGFEHTVILRPGLIVGERESSRPAEAVFRYFASSLGRLHSSLKDYWAQDASTIAKAGVVAGFKALEGDLPAGSGKVWILEQADIVRLGNKE